MAMRRTLTITAATLALLAIPAAQAFASYHRILGKA